MGLFAFLQQQQQQKWAKWLETNLIEPLLVKFIKTTQVIINDAVSIKIYSIIFTRFKICKYVYECMCICISVCIHECYAHGGHKRASDRLELELQQLWGSQWWVLEAKLESTGRAVLSLTCWVISSPHAAAFLTTTCPSVCWGWAIKKNLCFPQQPGNPKETSLSDTGEKAKGKVWKFCFRMLFNMIAQHASVTSMLQTLA